MRGLLVGMACVLVAWSASGQPAQPVQPPAWPLAESYLLQGRYEAGERDLIEALAKDPGNDQLRFGLGTVQFVRAHHGLVSALYAAGLKDQSQVLGDLLPIVRLPIPTNDHPQPLSYDALRLILDAWVEQLAKAEATLAQVRDPNVALPIRVGLIRFTLGAEGEKAPTMTLAQILERLGFAFPSSDPQLYIRFDRADVAWLRGYCHLLMALGNFFLAHDSRDLFETTGHLFFAEISTPHEFLTRQQRVFNWNGTDLMDLIAFIHQLRFEVVEPKRMEAALAHLEKTLALSRETWRLVLAESDDDHEWLPSPKQTGILRVPVTQEMVDAWLEMVSEAELILAGKRLVPFWRDAGGKG
ncbi:MAG TPA: hypothetical protein PKD86_13395, partial [Gemmatales bacterium]|nr:hypothetical protein [Gemmatales bacterium]